MVYSLKQAASVCGRSRSSVYEAIKSGRLKAAKNEKGRLVIQPDDLKTVFSEQSENVQAVHEKAQINDEKNSLFLQKIESLENTVAALQDERNEWREQAKAAAVTIEKQAAALAAATTASARAITQADEMRRQYAALEHVKADPSPDPTDAPQPRQWPTPATYWLAGTVALLGLGLAVWQAWESRLP